MFYNDSETVMELITNMETMDSDEFEEKFNQLDEDDQMVVRDAIRDFADNAIGDEHWDSDD